MCSECLYCIKLLLGALAESQCTAELLWQSARHSEGSKASDLVTFPFRFCDFPEVQLGIGRECLPSCDSGETWQFKHQHLALLLFLGDALQLSKEFM